jgi:hypothetical protein
MSRSLLPLPLPSARARLKPPYDIRPQIGGTA